MRDFLYPLPWCYPRPLAPNEEGATEKILRAFARKPRPESGSTVLYVPCSLYKRHSVKWPAQEFCALALVLHWVEYEGFVDSRFWVVT